jgi:hypothetical protein
MSSYELQKTSELYGLDTNTGRYRFNVDQANGKIRLFRKNEHHTLTPLNTWTIERLIQEMLANDK